MPKSDIAQRPPEMTILADHPARAEGDSPDLLGLESRLAAVFDILRHKNTNCPITIAVYGDWGTGKTSAMRWLETKLSAWNQLADEKRKNHPRVHPVWFDPWRYHTREEVWRGIVAEVILALFRVENLRSLGRSDMATRLRGAARKFGAFLGRGFLHALAHTEIEVGNDTVGKATFSGEMFQDIYEEFDKVNRPEKAHLNQFEDTLRQWLKDFLRSDDRLVLFIDDLDRCLPQVTLEVLEAIKLYLNLPQLLFVVGLDRAVVDAVVRKHYADSGLDGDKSRHYLNKLFQVEVQIPPSEQQMGDFFTAQLESLDQAIGGYWSEMLHEPDHRKVIEDVIRQLARHNPREIKRLLNSALMRGRAAAANSSVADASRKIRFAQGVQVYLLQRHIHYRLLNADRLLLTDANLSWFERASSFRAQNTNFDPSSPRKEGRPGDGAVPGKSASPKNVAFEALLQHPPQDDLGKPIDVAFLTDPLLWNLLGIPFSQEVAQSAPKVELRRTPALEPATDGGALLGELPPVIRERVAQSLNKPVDQLTAADLLGLNNLDLSESKAGNGVWGVIAKLPALQSLNLRGTTVTNAGLKELTALFSLQSLDLSETQVTDAGLKKLGKLASLRSLDLWQTKVTDAGLKELSKLSSLESLFLGNTKVTDTGFKDLTKLSALQFLSVARTQVTDAALKEMAKLSSLQWLYLWDTKITDAGLKELAKLSTLKSLDLSFTQVTDAGMKELAKLPALQSLGLSFTLVTDVGLRELAKLSALQSLDLEDTQVTDAGLKELSKLPALQSLDLANTQVTDAGVKELRKAQPKIEIRS